MDDFYRPPTRRCTEIGANVNVRQTEMSCRAQHGCKQRSCPLGAEFIPEPVDFMLETERLQQRA